MLGLILLKADVRNIISFELPSIKLSKRANTFETGFLWCYIMRVKLLYNVTVITVDISRVR